MEERQKIPLLRPEIFNPSDAFELILEANEKGRLSNFGPIYEQAAKTLSTMYSTPQFSTYPRHAVLTKSGTDAIKLALQQTLPRGSRVGVPDYTHIGAFNAVIAAGMRPVIIACRLRAMGPCLKTFMRYENEFDALIVSSCFGYCVDFEAYDYIAGKLSKPVIYDLAGGVGMLAPTVHPICFSFHATKNLSIGEGGAVLFKDKEAMLGAQRLANFDVDTTDGSILSPWGYNAKMDEVHAAFLLVALQSFEEAVIAKARVREQTINLYQNVTGIPLPGDRHMIARNGMPSLCVIFGIEHPELLAYRLKELDIESKPYYPLLSRIPSIRANFPVYGETESAFSTALALPSCVNSEEITVVMEELKQYLGSDGL